MKTTALLAAFAAATAAATCPDLTSQLEDLGDGALPMKESSGTSSDFATKGGTVAYGAKGAVGGAVDFSQATTKNYLMAADDDDLDGFADFTIADEAAFSNAVVATGRDDVAFGILATEDLTDWSNATLVPMTKFATDGLWRPTASESSGYVFPSQMFFKYTIEIQE